MVGFYDQPVTCLQVCFDHTGNNPKVSGDTQFASIGSNGKTSRIGSIMRDGKRMNQKLPYDKVPAIDKWENTTQPPQAAFGGEKSCIIDIYRQIVPSGQHTDALNMITVFVGNDTGIKPGRIQSSGCHPPLYLHS